VSRTLHDRALGGEIIERFMQNHHGTYAPSESKGVQTFGFSFPIHSTET
jgi:hypothetical protein